MKVALNTNNQIKSNQIKKSWKIQRRLTEAVNRRRDRDYNDQMKRDKRTNKNTSQKTKDQVRHAQLKTGGRNHVLQKG